MAVVSLILALFAVLASGTALAQFSAVGPEFQVSSFTTAFAMRPRLARLSDGTFLVLWGSYPLGGAADIRAQRVNSGGMPIGTEFQLNTYTTGAQFNPNVAVAEDGIIVTTWISTGQDGSGAGVVARRLSSAAAPIGTEFLVNTYTTSYQSGGSLAALAGGGFVVAWSGEGSTTNQYGEHQEGVDARFLNSAGLAIGSAFRVSDPETYYNGGILSPKVASRPDGNFVVGWGMCGPSGCDSMTGAFRIVAPTGTPVSDVHFLDNAPMAITSQPDSSFVTAEQDTSISLYQDVYGSRFAADGSLAGAFQSNSYTTDAQAYPDIASFSDGSFVVVWTSSPSGDGAYAEQDGSGSGIFGQVFEAGAVPVGTEFQINSYTTGSQNGVAVTATQEPGFMAVWLRSATVVAGQRFVPTCGDGIVALGEECEDGNQLDGDCCDSLCRLEPSGAACDDGNLCNGLDTCDGLGTCVPTTLTCKQPGRAQFQIRDSPDDTRDKLSWKWLKGDATLLDDFGEPGAATAYALCIYDSSDGVSELATALPVEPNENWSNASTVGFDYKDRAGIYAGITSGRLRAGIDGRPRLQFKAEGFALPMPEPFSPFQYFEQDPSVTVQLVNSKGLCWTSDFPVAASAKNDGSAFKAKIP